MRPSPTVLIVDDEPLIRKCVRDILEDDAYRVLEAADSKECLDTLGKEAVDVVLMDNQMPGTSGIETFKQMVRDDYRVDTIMISGHGNIETAVEAIKFGAHDFLEKPFSMARLRSTLGAVLRKREQVLHLEQMKQQQHNVGKYIIERQIASGGMATVYQALDSALSRPVALKILHPHLTGSASFPERFAREAHAMASLSHPNIVQVHDYGEHNQFHFLAMELVDGLSLDTFLAKEKRLPPHMCAAIGAQLCAALDHAHARGVVHRDIKPPNVLVSKSKQAKLVDFGLARCLNESAAMLTLPDQALGTPQFMSPEQVEGKTAGPASDLFSLGTLLYLMTTLRFPFPGPNLAAIGYAIAQCEYREPRYYCPQMDEPLNRVIVQCLQKDPENRFANAADMAKELTECQNHIENSFTDSGWETYFTEKDPGPQ